MTVVNPEVWGIQSGSVGGGYIMTDGMEFKHSSIMKVGVDILVIFNQQL